MNRLLACRVCLAYDTRLCSIVNGQLREIYEKLVEALLDTEDMLPTSVCYICYSLLKKMLQFRDRSQKANQILQRMISSGLELSVSSLDMLMKDQTGISWTLGLFDVERTTTTSAEDMVKVKIESVESEMDIDGMSDRNEVITKPDSREIILPNEEQLQEMCEQAKSFDYQNSPFKCDWCSEAFLNGRAYENHKKKHDEPSVSSVDLLDWHNRRTGIFSTLEITNSSFQCLNVERTTTTTAEVEVKVKIEAVESEMDIDGMSDRNEDAAPPDRRKFDKNETEKELVNIQAPLSNTQKDEEHIEKKDDKKKVPDFNSGSKKITSSKAILNETETTTSNSVSESQNDNEFNKIDTVTPAKEIFTCDFVKNEYEYEILLESQVIELNRKDSNNSDLNEANECKSPNLLKAQEIQNNDNRKENVRHINKFRDNTSKYECQYCIKRFSFHSHLISHLRVHTKEKPFKCDICEKSFSHKSDLTKHIGVHTKEKPYKCDICKNFFSHRANLIKHLRVHTKEKPFKCEICKKCFSASSYLTSHLRVHTKEKPYICDICMKSFSFKGSLIIHLRVHTKEKPFKCDMCDKCFADRSTLTKHFRVHTKEKPYKCHICDKCFAESSTLIKHLRVHTKEKPYKCDTCDKCFSESSTLTKHLRVHTKEKPFKCDICEKCFALSTSLNSHLRVHTKEKPYKCDICEKSFIQSSNLTTHSRVHTKKMPFKCDICKKCFTQSSNLNRHKKIHSSERPYSCSHCYKTFSDRSTLSQHSTVHTKEKPYKCETCDKCFSDRSSLTQHLRVHTKEKRFNCEMCEKGFTRKSYLVSHLRIHSAENL